MIATVCSKCAASDPSTVEIDQPSSFVKSTSGPPAVILERDDFALKAGQAVMKLLEKNLRPRDIVTRRSFENAAMVVAAGYLWTRYQVR